jgi:hypothetical protein
VPPHSQPTPKPAKKSWFSRRKPSPSPVPAPIPVAQNSGDWMHRSLRVLVVGAPAANRSKREIIATFMEEGRGRPLENSSGAPGREIDLGRQAVTIMLWNLPGQEMYHTLAGKYAGVRRVLSLCTMLALRRVLPGSGLGLNCFESTQVRTSQ